MSASQINLIVGITSAIVGMIIGIETYKRNAHKDIKNDAIDETKNKVEVNTKLDVLLSNNAEIRSSVKELDKKIDNFKDDVNIRLTRVEESDKQAHKRLDALENKNR